MAQQSVARRLEGTTSSLRHEAERSRKRVKLVGWCLLLWAALFGLLKVFVLLLGEVYDLAVAVSSLRTREAVSADVPQVGVRDLSSIVDRRKMLALHEEAREGLDVMARAFGQGADNDADSMSSALIAEIEGKHEAVGAVQESLAKSRSVGTAVGVSSWTLEQGMASLKEKHEKLLHENAALFEIAHQLKEDAGEGTASASSASASREWAEVKKMVSERLVQADVELAGVRTRLSEMEAEVSEALSFDEAEDMVAALEASIAASSEEDGTAEGSELSDVELEVIVKETLHAAEATLRGPDSCLSTHEAKDIIRKALHRYAADGTGLPDYAQAPLGGSVMEAFTSETFEPNTGWVGWMENFRSKRRTQDEQAISPAPVAIHPASQLGQCWPMAGQSGVLTVKLASPVRVDRVSIEHAPRVLLLNRGASAPKTFSVVGYPEGLEGDEEQGDVLIDHGEYKLDGDVIQFFDVARESWGVEYAAVALKVHSNHGSADFTCIYRLRVHGTPSTGASSSSS